MNNDRPMSLGELENRWGAMPYENSCMKCRYFDPRNTNRIVSECGKFPGYFTNAQLKSCRRFEKQAD